MTDTQLLDALQGLTIGYGRGWILRPSSSGRGWRLHETDIKGARLSVRKALELGIRKAIREAKP